jgi:hypothetical protein
MNTPREKLWNTLATAERETAQPVVPGELVPWARAVHGRLDEVADAWRQSNDDRKALERRTVDEDPELAARIRASRKTEAELQQRLDAVRGRLDGLREVERKASGSEEPLDEVRGLRRDILAWIVDVRVFGAELGTWRVEASHRDRGEV